jgi:predicted HicB family RNase H-like nuclease
MEKVIKSEYELLMEKFEKEGKVKNFSEEETHEIISELNKGLNDFLHKQKQNEKASEQELSGIVLNS